MSLTLVCNWAFHGLWFRSLLYSDILLQRRRVPVGVATQVLGRGNTSMQHLKHFAALEKHGAAHGSTMQNGPHANESHIKADQHFGQGNGPENWQRLHHESSVTFESAH